MELEKYDGSDPNLNLNPLNLSSGALLTELVGASDRIVWQLHLPIPKLSYLCSPRRRSNVFSSGRIDLLVPGVRHQCNGMGEILVD